MAFLQRTLVRTGRLAARNVQSGFDRPPRNAVAGASPRTPWVPHGSMHSAALVIGDRPRPCAPRRIGLRKGSPFPTIRRPSAVSRNISFPSSISFPPPPPPPVIFGSIPPCVFRGFMLPPPPSTLLPPPPPPSPPPTPPPPPPPRSRAFPHPPPPPIDCIQVPPSHINNTTYYVGK